MRDLSRRSETAVVDRRSTLQSTAVTDRRYSGGFFTPSFAAASIACTIRLWAPQRHRLPSIRFDNLAA